jgi:hypothetical protein
MILTRPRRTGPAQLTAAPSGLSSGSPRKSPPAPADEIGGKDGPRARDAQPREGRGLRLGHRRGPARRRGRRVPGDDPTVVGSLKNLNVGRQSPASRAGRMISLFSDAQKGERR